MKLDKNYEGLARNVSNKPIHIDLYEPNIMPIFQNNHMLPEFPTMSKYNIDTRWTKIVAARLCFFVFKIWTWCYEM